MRHRLALKARALQLLAQREHSRMELRRKLLAHASQQAATDETGDAGALRRDEGSFSRRVVPTEEVQAEVEVLLDWLAANRHLSEARFVEARVRLRAARQGNLRIRQELAQHGLELTAAEQLALKESEFARAKQVWSRKFDAPAGDAAERARHVRFLAGRGFSSEVIRRLLRGDED